MPKSKKKKNQRGGEDEQRQARLDEMAGLAAIFSDAFEQDDDELGFKLHLVCLNRATADFSSSVLRAMLTDHSPSGSSFWRGKQEPCVSLPDCSVSSVPLMP